MVKSLARGACGRGTVPGPGPWTGRAKAHASGPGGRDIFRSGRLRGHALRAGHHTSTSCQVEWGLANGACVGIRAMSTAGRARRALSRGLIRCRASRAASPRAGVIKLRPEARQAFDTASRLLAGGVAGGAARAPGRTALHPVVARGPVQPVGHMAKAEPLEAQQSSGTRVTGPAIGACVALGQAGQAMAGMGEVPPRTGLQAASMQAQGPPGRAGEACDRVRGGAMRHAATGWGPAGAAFTVTRTLVTCPGGGGKVPASGAGGGTVAAIGLDDEPRLAAGT